MLQLVEVQLHYKHGLNHYWLDSGIPASSQGLGAADLYMPFAAQVSCAHLAVSARIAVLLKSTLVHKHSVDHIANFAHVKTSSNEPLQLVISNAQHFAHTQ